MIDVSLKLILGMAVAVAIRIVTVSIVIVAITIDAILQRDDVIKREVIFGAVSIGAKAEIGLCCVQHITVAYTVTLPLQSANIFK